MSTPPLPAQPDVTWMEVAQAFNGFEAEIIVGLLRTANIPTYIENNLFGLPSTVLGQSSPRRIFVPLAFYEEALALLADDDEPPALDEPSIRL